MVYIRESGKKHGKKNMIEGRLLPERNYILFTDTLSSAGRANAALKAIADNGGKTAGIFTLIDLAGVETVNHEGKTIPVTSAMTLENLLECGTGKKAISETAAGKIRDWQEGLWQKNDIAASCRKGGENGKEAASQLQPEPGREKGKNCSCSSSGEREAEKAAAEILLDIKAVSLSVESPFRYASGILSPIYCDNRLLISSPDKWDTITCILEQIIREKIKLDNIECIAGTSTAGIPHAARLADRLSLPLVYVKSDRGERGRKTFIEGTLMYGKKVLVIEDLVSTGKSSIEAVRIIREWGGIVENCLAIFTYQMKSGVKAFEEEKCRLYTASSFRTLIETAVTQKYITAQEAEKATDWNRDPENWGRNHGYE